MTVRFLPLLHEESYDPYDGDTRSMVTEREMYSLRKQVRQEAPASGDGSGSGCRRRRSGRMS